MDYTTKLSNNTNPSPQNTDYEVLIDASLELPKVKAMIQQLNDLAIEIRELKQICEELKNLKT